MAFSRITYTYSGQPSFAINFELGYLKQSHVTCRVNNEKDGGGDPIYRPLTFVTEGTVTVGGDALVNGDTLVFERTVPKDEVQHDYEDGSILIESNLDESFLQVIMMAHEVLDGRFSEFTTSLDMGGNPILNIAQGLEPESAVTLQQMADAIAAASGLTGSFPAAGVAYDNSTSGLTATTVQSAIDELDSSVDEVNTFLGDLGDLAVLDTVGTTNIEDNAVTTDKIADDAVTYDKIASATETSILTTNKSTANEYTKTQNFNATILTDAASISWDAEDNQVCSVTLTDNRTLANPTNTVDGATYILIVKQDATGGRTLSFGSNFKWAGGTAPTLSTDANAVDVISFVCSGTDLLGVFVGDFS